MTVIAPVLILSTGRCGSTMVSEMLNRHPKVLSLSEFFVPLGQGAFAFANPDGARMWRVYAEQSAALHAMLKDGNVVDEALYDFDVPGARWQAPTLPPIAAVTLPHLSDDPEALFDELEPVVRALPCMPLADHYRALFGYLMKKYGRAVWVERSGGSLMLAAKLLRLFPDARVVHVFRDGRDTALSMLNHHNFRVLVAAIHRARRLGIDPCDRFLADRGSRLDYWMQQIAFRFMDVARLTEDSPSVVDLGAFWSRLIQTGERVFRHLGPDRRLDVRFEEVQSSPRDQLRRLIRFIDPSLEDESWTEEAAGMIRPTRSKFTTLPPEQQRLLTEACAPGLKLLGYAA